MNYFIESIDYNDYLEHHGVLGQKWGVRRYQPYSVKPRKSGEGGKEIGEAKIKRKTKTADRRAKDYRSTETVGRLMKGLYKNPTSILLSGSVGALSGAAFGPLVATGAAAFAIGGNLLYAGMGKIMETYGGYKADRWEATVKSLTKD